MFTVGTPEARAVGLLAFHSKAHGKIWGRTIRAERCARAPPSYTADLLRRRIDSVTCFGCAFQDLLPGNAKTGIARTSYR